MLLEAELLERQQGVEFKPSPQPSPLKGEGVKEGLRFNIRTVQSTFFLGRFFPPPSTFTLVLTWPNRAGTWFTSNRNESVIMQWVVWHFVVTNVLPNLLGCPVHEGVELGKGSVLFWPAGRPGGRLGEIEN